MLRAISVAFVLAPTLVDAPINRNHTPESLPSVTANPRLHRELGFARTVGLDSLDQIPRGDLSVSGIFTYDSSWVLKNDKRAIVGTLTDSEGKIPAVFIVNKGAHNSDTLKQNVYVSGTFDLCFVDPVIKGFMPKRLIQSFSGDSYFLATTLELASPEFAQN